MADTYWYRYDDIQYASPLDEYERVGIGEIKVHLQEYRVVKETPKGVWLQQQSSFSKFGDSDRRFVLKDARKRFACPTKEQAMESFEARKKAQIRIYTARIKRAEKALLDLERFKSCQR
jgi:hypothetical protein